MEWLCNIGPIFGVMIFSVVGLAVVAIIVIIPTLIVNLIEKYLQKRGIIIVTVTLALLFAIGIGYEIWDKIC